MKNQQLYSRLAPEAVERVIRRFNDRELTMQEAMAALSVSRAQVYNLRTQWLAAGKKASFLERLVATASRPGRRRASRS